MNKDHRLTVDEGDIYRRLSEMVEQGQGGVLATVIRTRKSTPRHEGSKMIILPDGSVVGSVGGGAAEARVIEEARQVFLDGRPRCLPLDLAGDVGVCGGHMEIFLEPVTRADPFIVIGAGHVGRALVEVGRTLPFRFTLIDDRPGLIADLEGLSGVRLLEASADDLASSLEVPTRGALLIASRNHELDGDYLEAVLEAERAAGRDAFLFVDLGGGSCGQAATQLVEDGTVVAAFFGTRWQGGTDLVPSSQRASFSRMAPRTCWYLGLPISFFISQGSF